MKLSATTAIIAVCSSGLLTPCVRGDRHHHTNGGHKNGNPNSGGAPRIDLAELTWSVVRKNSEWHDLPNNMGDQPYFPQVFYHTVEDAYELWENGYFDYVLDVRGREDGDLSVKNLYGWDSGHIPDSWPLGIFYDLNNNLSEKLTMVVDGTANEEVEMEAREEMLEIAGNMLYPEFVESSACKSSRVLVHCYSGVKGNLAAQFLTHIGFIDVHTMAPQGAGGIWAWNETHGFPIEPVGANFDEGKLPRCARQQNNDRRLRGQQQ